MKKTLIFLLAAGTLLTGCAAEDSNNSLVVTDSVLARGSFIALDAVISEATVFNPTKSDHEALIDIIIKDMQGDIIYTAIETYKIAAGQTAVCTVEWVIPRDIESGRYMTEMIVRDQAPDQAEAIEISRSIDEEGFVCYRKQENFDVLDKSIWGVSDSRLGRSPIKSRNVSVEEGMLKINLPENNLSGGEIFTTNEQSFGVFEARMKLPNTPTSITGFFLYKQPDFYHEIDIELYNEAKSTVLLTTYADGEIQNEYSGDLGFDPTAEFHDYRIEYFSDKVSFYIDDDLIRSWSDGIPQVPMRLMLNCWYPQWLDGLKAYSTQNLLVDWIRY